MPFKDLREYIDALEKEGELQRVEEEGHWPLAHCGYQGP